MPKSSRRKNGKKKAQQYSKTVKDKRIGQKIQQDRLIDKYQQEYMKRYEEQIKAELESRDDKLEKENSDKISSLTTDLKTPKIDFLGDAQNMFKGL